MAREYDKLVRDDIPRIIRESGECPVTHRVSGDEYVERLLDKLDEEVEEYCESRDVEELADILEVVHALSRTHDVSADALRNQREEKATERGRFDDGIVLDRVE